MFAVVTPEELKASLRTAGRRGLALDIDDVLSYTDNHWIEQMRGRFGDPDGLTREEVRDRYQGRFRDIAPWQTEEALAVIDQFVHSNEFQKTIPLVEGADETVRAIDALVPIVAYVTARPISVYEGTRAWLERHRFPAAPVIFRPLAIGTDERNTWKAEVLHTLHPEVTGIVDDHPKLAGQLQERGYRGRLYLYDSGQNMRSYEDATRSGSWSEILQLIREDLKEHAA